MPHGQAIQRPRTGVENVLKKRSFLKSGPIAPLDTDLSTIKSTKSPIFTVSKNPILHMPKQDPEKKVYHTLHDKMRTVTQTAYLNEMTSVTDKFDKNLNFSSSMYKAQRDLLTRCKQEQ